MNRGLAGVALAVLTAGLIACGDARRSETQTIDEAEGEILEASVRDDMLPYDTLRSQPPLAEVEEESNAKPAAQAAQTSADEADKPAIGAEAVAVDQPQPTPAAE